MSIFANNYIVDEETLEAKLPKHLNKIRIDRGAYNRTPGGWNKSGNKARIRGGNNNFPWGGEHHHRYSSKSQRHVWIIEKIK